MSEEEKCDFGRRTFLCRPVSDARGGFPRHKYAASEQDSEISDMSILCSSLLKVICIRECTSGCAYKAKFLEPFLNQAHAVKK